MTDQRGGVDPAAMVTRESPDPPAAALRVFGARLSLAERYVALLADSGLRQGLIGPREVPRLWERHVLNCAVVADLIGDDALVADVGSGAGLPGVPLAIARPDLAVVLVEPLLRRTRWLEFAVGELAGLGLTNVTVRRARAEALVGELAVDVATARAVSRLGQLATWCAPLMRPGGSLLALKGSSAAQELATDRDALAAAGLIDARVVEVGAGRVDPLTTVVAATKATTATAKATGRRGVGRGRRGR